MTLDALAGARGAVRDGVAALEHFVQVLASRRVGPRVLAQALPEVRDGCTILASAFGSLESELVRELATDTVGAHAARGLIAFATGRIAELETALAAPDGRSLDARERLAVEAKARPVAADLARVVRSLELVRSPGAARTSIDFSDALSARRSTRRPGTTPVNVFVDGTVAELRVSDAGLVLDLLEFALAFVVSHGVESPQIVLSEAEGGAVVLTIGAPPREQAPSSARHPVDVFLRSPLPHEHEVILAAARRAEIGLSIGEDSRTVVMTI